MSVQRMVIGLRILLECNDLRDRVMRLVGRLWHAPPALGGPARAT